MHVTPLNNESAPGVAGADQQVPSDGDSVTGRATEEE